MDEKPQIQAAQGTAPTPPLRPGQAERPTHDDRRHGTLDLFAALAVKAGLSALATSRRGIGPGPMVMGVCERRHRSIEFRAFLDRVEPGVPPGFEVYLVLDNLKTRLIHDWLVKRPHFHLHVTPTSASWLNLVECWFVLLTSRRPERGAFTSTSDLEAAILTYIAETDADPKPFVWAEPADDILASVASFCQRTSNSGH